jgi:hypothetical protein
VLLVGGRGEETLDPMRVVSDAPGGVTPLSPNREGFGRFRLATLLAIGALTVGVAGLAPVVPAAEPEPHEPAPTAPPLGSDCWLLEDGEIVMQPCPEEAAPANPKDPRPRL